RLHPVHEIDELGDPQSVLAAQIFMPRGDAGVDQRDADAGAVVPEVLADGRAPIVAAVASIVPRTERSSEICAMWGLCERPTSAAFGTTAARELMMPSLRPATPPARAIAGPTSSSDARSTARMITRDSPVPSAACARTIGPSFNPGSDGCVAAEGAITPKDSTAASATGKVVREATCDAPLPALRAAGRRSEPEPGTFLCCGGRQGVYNGEGRRAKIKSRMCLQLSALATSADHDIVTGHGYGMPSGTCGSASRPSILSSRSRSRTASRSPLSQWTSNSSTAAAAVACSTVRRGWGRPSWRASVVCSRG